MCSTAGTTAISALDDVQDDRDPVVSYLVTPSSTGEHSPCNSSLRLRRFENECFIEICDRHLRLNHAPGIALSDSEPCRSEWQAWALLIGGNAGWGKSLNTVYLVLLISDEFEHCGMNGSHPRFPFSVIFGVDVRLATLIDAILGRWPLSIGPCMHRSRRQLQAVLDSRCCWYGFGE